MPKKNIFISSTISDLEKERSFIKKFLESYDPIKITCYLSETPEFPVTPVSLLHDVYQVCIDNILKCDYMIQILNKRYGVSDIFDKGNQIAITHKEYRVAFDNRIPTFTFISSNLWEAFSLFKSGSTQNYIEKDQRPIFDFIDEIQGHFRKKWIFRFKSFQDIELALKSSLFNFDDSVFISDVTVPDGTIFMSGDTFEKAWELKNNGMVIWKNRFLKEINPDCGLTPESSLISIPKTKPGESVVVKIKFKTPASDAGTYLSYWKMVDSSGNYSFTWKRGVWCKVKVVDRPYLK